MSTLHNRKRLTIHTSHPDRPSATDVDDSPKDAHLAFRLIFVWLDPFSTFNDLAEVLPDNLTTPYGLVDPIPADLFFPMRLIRDERKKQGIHWKMPTEL
jgi:hypothetical protein